VTLRVFVSGQRAFGAAVADLVVESGHELVGVASPAYAGEHARLRAAEGDETMPHDRLRIAATYGHHVPWTEAPALRAENIPDGIDVILAAHSHAFLGRKSRARAGVSVGYHPSLLPLHRGRDAVRWTVRDRDKVAGGSVYHLTDAVDGGPLAAQDYVLIPPGITAQDLWRDLLFPLGLDLFARVLAGLDDGHIAYVPQDETCATWEPSWDRPRLHRPELPELPAPGTTGLRYVADPAALRR
jgi:methionyl-tRNA formyltransferase